MKISFLLLFISLFFSACSSKNTTISEKPIYRCSIETVIAPEWICLPQLDGYISVVGIAPYSINAIQQRQKAQEDAEKRIDSKILACESKIKLPVKQYKSWKHPKTKTLYLLYRAKIN